MSLLLWRRLDVALTSCTVAPGKLPKFEHNGWMSEELDTYTGSVAACLDKVGSTMGLVLAGAQLLR